MKEKENELFMRNKETYSESLSIYLYICFLKILILSLILLIGLMLEFLAF